MHSEMTVGFKRLEVSCLVGTCPHEKLEAQKILISVSAVVNVPKVDALAATVDYGAMADVCRKTCQRRHRGLLETLAQEILNALMETFPMHALRVTLEKPSAFDDAECALVEIRGLQCAGR